MTSKSHTKPLHHRRTLLAVVSCLLVPLACLADGPVAVSQVQTPDRPFTEWTDAEKEEFLRTAEIVELTDIEVGITRSKRATLDDGRTRHDAHVQTIDEFKPGITDVPGQPPQMNFRDSYKFNIAGYRLDRLLDLNMVPVSVYRVVRREEAAVTWWVDEVQMMEKDRLEAEVQPPDVRSWNDQMFTARAFTELIYNTDANLGNFLITDGWRLRMIDFTRAFRRNKTLKSPENLGPRLARRAYLGLRALTPERLNEALEELLDVAELEGLLARRELILEHFDQLIAERGEDAVLYDEPGR